MQFLIFVSKILLIAAFLLLMAFPFLLEYLGFKRDKKNKISYKRFRIVVFTLIYVVLITVAMYLLKEVILFIEGLQVVSFISSLLAIKAKTVYFVKLLVAIAVNFVIGVVFKFFLIFVRIGLKKMNLEVPKKDGEFSFSQKIERKVIKFFNTETWFFVGKIVKYLSILLSVVYSAIFALYMIPAFFTADFIPYNFIEDLFTSAYMYPVITLLALWETYFFLEGIRNAEMECPELIAPKIKEEKNEIDLVAIDEAIKKHFNMYYACDVELSKTLGEKLAQTDYHDVTKTIGRSVEFDSRNPQPRKETYLNCIDKVIKSENSILVNGNFFSEFSMYFIRYISIIAARGDNIVFVCNTDAQIDSLCEYLKEGLSKISSLYFDEDEKIKNSDDPIWKIDKVGSDYKYRVSAIDADILVTSLDYLCSPKYGLSM